MRIDEDIFSSSFVQDCSSYELAPTLRRAAFIPALWPLRSHTVTAEARVRESGQNPTKFMLKRDTRASRKAELERYLSAIDWPPLLSSLYCCEDMLNVIYKALRTGLDLLMPIKKVRVNTSDVPWMTQHLKSLILKRQKAFHEHVIKAVQYKFYHNAVNSERKSCKAVFYETKVQSMKEENPKAWWGEVKRFSTARAHSGALCNHIHARVLKSYHHRIWRTLSMRRS